MYKVLLFDFYDVLYTDSYKTWLARNDLERTGPFKQASELLDKGQIDWDEFLGMIASATHQTPAQITAVFHTLDRLDHELVDFLKALHNNYPLGLISNGRSSRIRGLFQQYQLDSLFDEVVISSEVSYRKKRVGF